jgi:CBS domain-containing protein
VKKVKLSKALTIPDGTTVTEACRRMATRRVDAVLLADFGALLSVILTDKDVATRVVAEELSPDETHVSKVMTRNPIFVTSDTLAIDALQKMIQGKFRHLPVVENGGELKGWTVWNLVQSEILEEEEDVKVEDQNGTVEEEEICDAIVTDERQERSWKLKGKWISREKEEERCCVGLGFVLALCCIFTICTPLLAR